MDIVNEDNQTDCIKDYPAIREAVKKWHKSAQQAIERKSKDEKHAIATIRAALDAMHAGNLSEDVAKYFVRCDAVDSERVKVVEAYLKNMKWPQRCSPDDVDAALRYVNPLEKPDAIVYRLDDLLSPSMNLNSIWESDEFPLLTIERDSLFADDVAGNLETPRIPNGIVGDFVLPSGVRVKISRISSNGWSLAPSSYTFFGRLVGAQMPSAVARNIRIAVPLIQSCFRTCLLTYHFSTRYSYAGFRQWRDGTPATETGPRSDQNGSLAVEAMIRVCTGKPSTDLDRRIQMAMQLIMCADQSSDHRASVVMSMSAVESILCSESSEVSKQVQMNSVWLLASGDEKARIQGVKGVRELYNKRSAFVHGDDGRTQASESDAESARQLAAGVIRAAFFWRTMLKEHPEHPRKALLDALEAARLGSEPLLGVPAEFAWCLPGGHGERVNYHYSKIRKMHERLDDIAKEMKNDSDRDDDGNGDES
jgi:hypothetical protein